MKRFLIMDESDAYPISGMREESLTIFRIELSIYQIIMLDIFYK